MHVSPPRTWHAVQLLGGLVVAQLLAAGRCCAAALPAGSVRSAQQGVA